MNWIDEANKKLEEQRANYKESVENGEVALRVHSASSVFGGNVTGPKNKENGTMKKCIEASTSNKDLQSAKGKKGGSNTGKKEWTCPHCTKTGTGPVMTRFHMDNCTIWQPFKSLPNDMSFTIKEVMTYLNENGFEMTFSNAKQFIKNHPLIKVDGITIGGVPTKYKKI